MQFKSLDVGLVVPGLPLQASKTRVVHLCDFICTLAFCNLLESMPSCASHVPKGFG